MLVIGIVVGLFLAHIILPPQADNTISREGGYQFINPLLSCDISEDTEYSGYYLFQKKLQQTADASIEKGDAKRISVYFRNMDYGYWTGVRVTSQFIPASLIKVPLLIAYLYESRTNPNALSAVYRLDKNNSADNMQHFKPSHSLISGQSYDVQQLLDAMVRYSDNNAAQTLADHVPMTTLQNIYFNFNVPATLDESIDSVSPQDYMRFFRILYNATYLGRARSQEALESLAQTDFNQGLMAGVPPHATMSHKFGERTVYAEDPSTGAKIVAKRELHDCGIVYYAGAPYGLCVMTEGDDFGKLSSVIAYISSITYQEVSNGLLKR